MDWRNARDYEGCDDLDASAWAWQFLRRNAEYRADFAWFIATWRALEADYGAPPQRDFFRWKQDARAWRGEAELADCAGDACPGENDEVLIECWMGVKWGFRKFPPDPAVDFPEDLAWREQTPPVEPVDEAICARHGNEPSWLALSFDLDLPLPLQLEAARRQLIAAAHLRRRQGLLPPRGAREGRELWRRWLRLLDGLDDGASLSEIGECLVLADAAAEARAAKAMAASGYRRLLF